MTLELNIENPNVIRLDYSDDNKWNNLRNEIQSPRGPLGFQPNVEFYSDKSIANITLDELLKLIPKEYYHSFIFVVDSFTITDNESPILCVDIKDNPGDWFRVIPEEMWSVENNLSISNMDFEEFVGSADKDGVFRGH